MMSIADHMIHPDRQPRWTINGHTMEAEGPWLKNASRVEVVPASEAEELRSSAEYLQDEINRQRRVMQEMGMWDDFCAVYAERQIRTGDTP